MNHMTPEVICIGQAVIDCITREMDRAPFSEGKARARSITLNAGGDAMNESCVLAGMGRRAELVCGTGDDFAGQYLLDQARQKGVGTDRAQVVPGMQTPVANMFVAADGSRSSVSSLATLLEGYIPDPGDQRGVKVMSLASLFRAPLDQAEIVCGLVRAAHTAGAGDNFVAGFIDGLLRGFAVKDCCRAGLEQAALSVQHVGAT